mmetsp:Transcript_8857/g.18748  ORF Transcript_8857/g.18748 Transcript_8857/m.18748 type:complete len:111 (-) Transcript_8857:962-1294(-)
MTATKKTRSNKKHQGAKPGAATGRACASFRNVSRLQKSCKAESQNQAIVTEIAGLIDSEIEKTQISNARICLHGYMSTASLLLRRQERCEGSSRQWYRYKENMPSHLPTK